MAATAGFGFSLVAAPPLLLLYDPVQVTAMLLILALATRWMLLTDTWRTTNARTICAMLPTAWLGIGIGILVVRTVDPRLHQAAGEPGGHRGRASADAWLAPEACPCPGGGAIGGIAERHPFADDWHGWHAGGLSAEQPGLRDRGVPLDHHGLLLPDHSGLDSGAGATGIAGPGRFPALAGGGAPGGDRHHDRAAAGAPFVRRAVSIDRLWHCCWCPGWWARPRR